MKGRKKSTVAGASWMIVVEGFTFHVYGKSGAWTAIEEVTGAVMTEAKRTIELAVMAAKALAEAEAALIPTVNELATKVNGARTQRTVKAAKQTTLYHGAGALAVALALLAIALTPIAYVSNLIETETVEVEG